MKRLFELLEKHQAFGTPLDTLILLGAGRANAYAMQASKLAGRVILVDADEATCQANCTLLRQFSTWQVMNATVAALAGQTTFYRFNASRFNGLVPMIQIKRKPNNVRQIDEMQVDAIDIGALLQQLATRLPFGNCAILIDLGDLSWQVLENAEPMCFKQMKYLGVALHHSEEHSDTNMRLSIANTLGLQMLTMQCDANGHESSFLYKPVETHHGAVAELLDVSESSSVEVAELRRQLESSNALRDSLIREMETMSLAHMRAHDEATQEQQTLKAELAELKMRHKKFNDQMVRAESQLDLIKTLLFRDSAI